MDNDLVRYRLARHTQLEDGGCWLWTGSTSNGYGQLSIRSMRKRPFRAHVLAYELDKGPVPAGLMVRHTCHVRNCVNPAHLEVGTAWDNADDNVRAGRVVRGEKHPQCKLTDAQVDEIVARRLSGRWTNQELAEEFGISPSYVHNLAKGLTRRSDYGRSQGNRDTPGHYVKRQVNKQTREAVKGPKRRKPRGILEKRAEAMRELEAE